MAGIKDAIAKAVGRVGRAAARQAADGGGITKQGGGQQAGGQDQGGGYPAGPTGGKPLYEADTGERFQQDKQKASIGRSAPESFTEDSPGLFDELGKERDPMSGSLYQGAGQAKPVEFAENGMPLFDEEAYAKEKFARTRTTPSDRLADGWDKYNRLAMGPEEKEAKEAEENKSQLGDFYDAYYDYAGRSAIGSKYSNPLEFMEQGSSDDWYNFVTDDAISPYYQEYYDQYGDFSADRELFDNFYNEMKGYSIDDYLGGDDAMLRRLYGDDAAMIGAINDALASSGYGYALTDAEGRTVDGTDPAALMNYSVLGRYLNSFGDDAELASMFDADELNFLAMLDAFEWGQGDEFRENTDKVGNLPDDPGTLNWAAYQQYGVPYAGLPDLINKYYGDLGYTEKRNLPKYQTTEETGE